MIKLIDNCVIKLDDAAKVRVTPDGYLVATPRVARTGIQLYRGSEVGLADNKIVKIYRPEDQVFDEKSMITFAHKPVTNDHPSEPVTSRNWSKYAKGQIGDEIARDGEFIRVPMVLMDQSVIDDVKSGKAELSVGYSCDVDMTPGVTPDGQAYDGVQKNIRVNHTAVVDAARAGHMARFGDGTGETRVNLDGYAAAMGAVVSKKFAFPDHAVKASSGFLGRGEKYPVMVDGAVDVTAVRAVITDSIAKGDGDVTTAARSLLAMTDSANPRSDAPLNTEKVVMAKHMIDGITVEMEDTAKQVVDKALGTKDTQIETLKGQVSTLTADHAKVVTDKDAQIAKLTADLTAATTKATTLETQLKDATLTPEKIETLVRDRSTMIMKAKALHPQVVIDGKTDDDIRRQVVDAKIGEVAKGWTGDQLRVGFDTLAAQVDVSQMTDSGAAPAGTFRDFASSFSAPAHPKMDQVYDARDKRLEDAWKGPQHGKA